MLKQTVLLTVSGIVLFIFSCSGGDTAVIDNKLTVSVSGSVLYENTPVSDADIYVFHTEDNGYKISPRPIKLAIFHSK